MLLTRRNFLASTGVLVGASGLGVGLGSRETRAADGDPRRFVIFIEGNGTRPECLIDPTTRGALEAIAGEPIASHKDYAHDDPVVTLGAALDEARALGALAAGPGKISLVDRAAVVLGLSCSFLGGGHSQGHGALSAAKAAGGPAKASIDTVLGQVAAVRGMTPFDVVRVGAGASTSPLNYGSCAFAQSKAAPILLSPAASFTTLFGSVATGQAAADFAASKRLIEFGLEDTGRELKRLAGSQRGRDKVLGYQASLQELLARNEQLAGMKDVLTAVKPQEPGVLDPDPYATTDFLAVLGLQVDVALAALLGELTHVVVVSLGSGDVWSNDYPSLIDLYPNQEVIGGHDLRHMDGDVATNVLHEVTSRGVGEMARMARALADRPEGGGSMLDNTLLLYMSDNGERHHTSSEEWAMVMVGGKNMGFKTDGRSVAYPRHGHENNRQTSNMFNSLLYGAGLPTDDFGHNNPKTRIAPGPLSDLWS